MKLINTKLIKKCAKAKNGKLIIGCISENERDYYIVVINGYCALKFPTMRLFDDLKDIMHLFVWADGTILKPNEALGRKDGGKAVAESIAIVTTVNKYFDSTVEGIEMTNFIETSTDGKRHLRVCVREGKPIIYDQKYIDIHPTARYTEYSMQSDIEVLVGHGDDFSLLVYPCKSSPDGSIDGAREQAIAKAVVQA